jgi:hypothetical protein
MTSDKNLLCPSTGLVSASCQLTRYCATDPEVLLIHVVSKSLHWHVGKLSMAVITCASHLPVSQ